ncbi:hypothetical protein TNCV_4645211 [Trichonephila clavipes]|nr:hypothetical protein TNCV_4645211 [Trichonephila clavipes]
MSLSPSANEDPPFKGPDFPSKLSTHLSTHGNERLNRPYPVRDFNPGTVAWKLDALPLSLWASTWKWGQGRLVGVIAPTSQLISDLVPRHTSMRRYPLERHLFPLTKPS